jgi:hypothetical protein
MDESSKTVDLPNLGHAIGDEFEVSDMILMESEYPIGREYHEVDRYRFKGVD